MVIEDAHTGDLIITPDYYDAHVWACTLLRGESNEPTIINCDIPYFDIEDDEIII